MEAATGAVSAGLSRFLQVATANQADLIFAIEPYLQRHVNDVPASDQALSPTDLSIGTGVRPQ